MLTTTALGVTATQTAGVLPEGASVAGIALGGLPVQEAMDRLDAAQLAAPQVVVRANERSWTVDGAELGWRPDARATIVSLQAQTGNVLERTLARLSGHSPTEGQVIAQVDAEQAKRTLDALTQKLNRTPQNAGIFFDSSARRFAARPDVSGLTFDTQLAANHLAQHPDLLALEVPFSLTRAAFGLDAAQRVVDDGNRLLRPLSLRLDGSARSLQLTPVQVANLYWVRPSGIELDEKTIALAVDRTSRELGQVARNARFVPQQGRLVVQHEQQGLVASRMAAIKALRNAVLQAGVTSVTLPSELSAPALSASQLPDPSSLTVIGEGRSVYLGSSAQRVTNVSVAARKLSGYVVAPGEDFSFLGAIGRITSNAGFASALVISGGRTVEGIGGGVCQVSTTAFRALYSAGLPVVERHQHAYRVGWYNPQIGFEAAVYDPGLDLRMKNDTGGPLLVRAFNDPQKGLLVVRLYGLAQQRTVSVSPAVILSRTPAPPPQYVVNPRLNAGQRRQVDWAADGYTLFITRTITDAQGQRTEKLSTNYRPWTAVYEIAPPSTPVPARVTPPPPGLPQPVPTISGGQG